MKIGVWHFILFCVFLMGFFLGFVSALLIREKGYFYNSFFRSDSFLIEDALDAISSDPRLNYAETRKKVRKAFVVIDEKGFPESPEEKFIMAVQYYKEGEVDKATTLLFDITKYSPNFCDAYAYLGYILCYEEENNDDLVVGLLEKAIKCNPNKSLYYNWLGSYYKNRISSENEKEYKAKAKECYKKALSLNEEDVSAWNNYGNLLVDLGEYEEAERVYKRAIEIFPTHGTPQYNLASLMALKGDKESALKWLKDALKYNPELRRVAKEDEDFKIIRDDPRFQELLRSRIKEEVISTLSSE